jgi:hypothetical protein
MTEERPIRKRRRPALSCAECRRRKVKCDRNNPCGPCMAYKSPTCTYTDPPATASRASQQSQKSNHTTSTSVSNISTPSTHQSSTQVPNSVEKHLSYASSIQSAFSISTSPFARPAETGFQVPSSPAGNPTLAPFNENPQLLLPTRETPQLEQSISGSEEFQARDRRNARSERTDFRPAHKLAIPGLRGMLSKTYVMSRILYLLLLVTFWPVVFTLLRTG